MEIWKELDAAACGFIPVEKIKYLYFNVDYPLGWKGGSFFLKTITEKRRNLIIANLSLPLYKYTKS